jgi:hypothetical protein
MCTQRPNEQSLTASRMKAWSASLVAQLQLLEESLLAVQECLVTLREIILCIEVAIAEDQEGSGSSLALGSVDALGPVLDTLTEIIGMELPVLGVVINVITVFAGVSVAIHCDALQVLGGQQSVEHGWKSLLPIGEHVTLPTAQEDAQQRETVLEADAEEEFLESNGVFKLQSLTVEDWSSLLVNGLANTQDGWVEVLDFLVIGFVDGLQERLSSTLTLLLFVEESTSNNFLTCLALSKEGERSGVLFEKVLVDHGADLKRKIHERKGNILQRLLGLGLSRALALGLSGLRIQRSIMGRSCCIWVLDLPEGEQRC